MTIEEHPIYDVVIVGAGISGTIAAKTLIESGVTNILVLEARDRCGGRIMTDRTTFDVPVDLGASWIHDTGAQGSGQFIQDIAQELGVKTINESDSLQYYDQDGLISDDNHARLLAVDTIDSLRQFETDQDFPDSSLKEFWTHSIESLEGTPVEKAKALQIARECELWHGTDWDKQSAIYGSIATEGDGDGEAIVVDGYDTIYNHIRGSIPDRFFRLNTYVSSVERITPQSPLIDIHTRDDIVIKTRYAILTIPIGVLKAQDVKFRPRLPRHIQMATDCSSLGYLGKMYLEFPHVFWPSDVQQFMILANDNNGSPIFVLNLLEATNKPMLMLLTPPALTLKLEAAADSVAAFDLIADQLAALNQDKSQPLPRPTKTKTTSWVSDPLSRCSYVAVGPNEDPISNADAWQQGWGSVRFAGEHTVWTSQGCVQGAWNSGIREANYVIANLAE